MNYIKSVIINFISLSVLYVSVLIGNKYRIFTRQSAHDMNAAGLLLTLIFLVTCIAFAAYYLPASKKRAESFAAIDQNVLKRFMKRSVAVLVAGDLLVLGFSVINGLSILLENGKCFCIFLVMIGIMINALLYIAEFRHFQPKGIFLRTNTQYS